MAFNREVEVIVAAPELLNFHETPKTQTEGVLLSGLDLDFKVERSNVFAENTAELTIYNADAETRTKLLREGANITISAGYTDQWKGLIFIGNICAESQHYREDDGTFVTKIKAASVRADDKPLETTLVSLSFSKGTTLKSVLSEIAISQGVILHYAIEADLPQQNGFAYAGKIRGALELCQKILRSSGYGLFIDNGELVVYALDAKDSTYIAASLTYDTGLLSVTEVTPAVTDDKNIKNKSKKKLQPAKKYKLLCLINPNISPNSVVHVKAAGLDDNYIVQKATFMGDNYGNKFECELEVDA